MEQALTEARAKSTSRPDATGEVRPAPFGVMTSFSAIRSLRRDAAAEFSPPNCVSKILVPIDFSPASIQAVQRAVALAHQCDAALTLLHVIDLNAQGTCGPAAGFMAQLWQQGSEKLANLAHSISEFAVQILIEEGLPWSVIVDKSCDVDLLILGRSAKQGPWRPFARHTLQRVLEQAACPVLVVNDSAKTLQETT